MEIYIYVLFFCGKVTEDLTARQQNCLNFCFYLATNADKLFTYQISEQGCLEADIINMESTITVKYGWVDMLQISVSFPWRTDDTVLWFKEGKLL